MAKPLVLFENSILEDATMDHETGSTNASYPFTNAVDWRYGTAYRWRSGAAEQTTIRFDTGVEDGGTADCLAMGGHNLGTGTVSVRVRYSEDGSAWSNAFTTTAITSDKPFVIPFTTQTERWWDIEFTSVGAVLQVGIMTLGRRLDIEGGALADLDPYGYSVVQDGITSENGSPIGVNIRYVEKRFGLRYGPETGGMTRDTFYNGTTTVNFDDEFTPHLENGKPFWFAWNTDVADNQQVYLCRNTGGVRMPFVGSTKRRALSMEFTGWAEKT